MIKIVGVGAWTCAVALISTYVAATWQSGAPVPILLDKKEPSYEGLEYRKPPALTVPMISDGRLRGYVIAKIVFTGDAAALHAFPIDPQPFVLDEAFRRIYTDGKVEFDQLSKYNLEDMTKTIKANVNTRLGADLIHDVLIDEVSYVDKETLNKKTASAAK